jgi:hypothetical protein
MPPLLVKTPPLNLPMARPVDADHQSRRASAASAASDGEAATRKNTDTQGDGPAVLVPAWARRGLWVKQRRTRC